MSEVMNDWQLCCAYLKEMSDSGRTRFEEWELELQRWDSSDDETLPGGAAMTELRRWAIERGPNFRSKIYRVTSIEDFEVFLAEFTFALTQICGPDLAKAALGQMGGMTRATISLGTGPQVIYFIDADDRIRWEEIDEYGHRSLAVQVPKV
jgi:hypothetical protein